MGMDVEELAIVELADVLGETVVAFDDVVLFMVEVVELLVMDDVLFMYGAMVVELAVKLEFDGGRFRGFGFCIAFTASFPSSSASFITVGYQSMKTARTATSSTKPSIDL